MLALRTKARSVEEQNNALTLEIAQLRGQLDGNLKLDDCSWDALWCGGGVEAKPTNVNDGIEEKWMGEPDELPTWEQGSVDACNALVRRPRESEGFSMSVRHADIAMEFVLTYVLSWPCRQSKGLTHTRLEKPCIQRAQSSIFDPLNPYPLSHGTSNAELAVYHSFVEDQIAMPGSCTQADISSSLENLLSLSSAFCLANEITPIQAWQQLCKYSEFGKIDMKGLQELMEALLEHVRCYGSVAQPVGLNVVSRLTKVQLRRSNLDQYL